MTFDEAMTRLFASRNPLQAPPTDGAGLADALDAYGRQGGAMGPTSAGLPSLAVLGPSETKVARFLGEPTRTNHNYIGHITVADPTWHALPRDLVVTATAPGAPLTPLGSPVGR